MTALAGGGALSTERTLSNKGFEGEYLRCNNDCRGKDCRPRQHSEDEPIQPNGTWIRCALEGSLTRLRYPPSKFHFAGSIAGSNSGLAPRARVGVSEVGRFHASRSLQQGGTAGPR